MTKGFALRVWPLIFSATAVLKEVVWKVIWFIDRADFSSAEWRRPKIRPVPPAPTSPPVAFVPPWVQPPAIEVAVLLPFQSVAVVFAEGSTLESVAEEETVAVEPKPPVVADTPKLVAEIKRRPADQLVREAWNQFMLFLNHLDREDFLFAKRLVVGMYAFGPDGQQVIAGLEPALKDGRLEKYIAVGLTFKWKDADGGMQESERFSDVPREKQALSLMWALFNQAEASLSEQRPITAPVMKIAQPLPPETLKNREQERLRKEKFKQDVRNLKALFEQALRSGAYSAANAHLHNLEKLTGIVPADLWAKLAGAKAAAGVKPGVKQKKRRPAKVR